MEIGTAARKSRTRPGNRSERIYEELKADIFDFRLLPGDRFTENEIAERTAASRTPVREALYRLQREGYVEVQFRNGWQVRPFDFRCFEELYDVRIILEMAAVRRLCEAGSQSIPDALKSAWLIPDNERLSHGPTVSGLDERFHEILVEAAGNHEMAAIHRGITDRLRIIRRLDFTKEARIDATYHEHADILRAIVQRRSDQAQMLLKSHIESSKSEVRKITLHRLQSARQPKQSDATEP